MPDSQGFQSAYDNLRQLSLYSDNPQLIVSNRRVQTFSNTFSAAAGAITSQVGTIALAPPAGGFAVDSGALIDQLQLTLSASAVGASQATSATLAAVGFDLEPTPQTGSTGEPIGQNVATGLLIPTISSGVGTGLNAIIIPQGQPYLVAFRDWQKDPLMPGLTFPFTTLNLNGSFAVANGNAAAITIAFQITLKWRLVSGISNEG